MTRKVRFEVIQGSLKGKVFEFEEGERIYIGRHEDCPIVLPERTVSRYHCVLQILPDEVRLYDFGSKNGTFLNGEKIGQREETQSWEDVKDQSFPSYPLHDGDILGLSSRCKLKCSITSRVQCPVCGKELPQSGDGADFRDAEGRRVCQDCHKQTKRGQSRRTRQDDQAEADRKKAEEAAAEFAALFQPGSRHRHKKCVGCGRLYAHSGEEGSLCPECRKERGQAADAVLAMLGVGGGKKREESSAGAVDGYEKIERIGKGGMGEVWKVRDRETGRFYALKTMLPKGKADVAAQKRFLQEGSIGQVMHHKNVVHTYKTGCANGTFYILMDLYEGGSVDDLIHKRGGKLPLDVATWIILQALTGLDYAHNVDIDVEIQRGAFEGTRELHAKGIVHRDFKPGNIFLSDESDRPTALVADLGFAKAFDAAGLTDISRTGETKGSAGFMCRQQALNHRDAKPEVDVWAAAASYYYMLTGKLPKNFRPGENRYQVIVHGQAVPILQRDPAIPERIAVVVDRALQDQGALHYTCVADFRRDLEDALPRTLREQIEGVVE